VCLAAHKNAKTTPPACAINIYLHKPITKIEGGSPLSNRRISHSRGRGSLNHNNRNYIYKNVDESRTHLNIYYAKENLSEAYDKCFGEAVSDYNTKQKRADRKIENYYFHLFSNANKDTVATSSNKEKSFYEIVVGIGDMNNTAVGSAEGEIAANILDVYAKGFSERNPNFYVFNSVLHLDEKTPHLHIDYIPIADGYKNGMAVRNSQSVALQQMGFGKNKNSINEWRIQERQILRALCQQYGLEVAEESKGRGKTHTPDEYKKIRDEVKDELRADPDIVDEIKDEIRVDIQAELLSEQQHLIDEVAKRKEEISNLQGEKSTLQNDIKQERKNFTDMQTKFKPRKDDLQRVLKLAKETKPPVLSSRVSLTKDDWDFIVGIAKQHARISDITLTALEKHDNDTEMLKRCQSLYLAVASEVAAITHFGDRNKLKHAVQDVLKDIEDWRYVAWAMDDMADQTKPSKLADILKNREAKITKKRTIAEQLKSYNQPYVAPQKTKTRGYTHEDR